MDFLTPVLQFISYAFVAAILVFVLTIIFFRKIPDAYTFLLKWCLIGIVAGIAASYLLCHFAHKFCLTEPKTEITGRIPFWTTLAGLLTGMWLLTGRDPEAHHKDLD